MPQDVHPEPTAIPAPEAELLAGTEWRINRAMLVLGMAGTVVCSVWGGMAWGAGFAIGAALSALNFRWMKGAVHALADAAMGQLAQPPRNEHAGEGGAESQPEEEPGQGPAQRAQPGRGMGVVVRFVLRYALIGLVAYAIFISSFVSLGAFFAGLFVFIAAILAEVGYEIYAAFRSA